MADILVYIEHDDDGITDLSLQCLARARQLAAGGVVSCLVAGADAATVAGALHDRGADYIYTVSSDDFANYLAAPACKAMAAAVTEAAPRACLLPSSTVGNDLAPRLAGVLGAAAVLDCTGLDGAGDRLVPSRLEFDTKAVTRFDVGDGPLVATLRDGIAAGPGSGGAGETADLAVALDAADLQAVVERRVVAQKTVNLKDAKVIVGGGAGVGSAENFSLLEALARKLNGEVGATRAAVDAGWLSAERQIGQTGVTVRPDLYIACGISGAVQHCVGIRESRTIVAVNTDPSAPIFRIAHYRVVGDLAVVLPKLTALLG